jgi:protein SCO1/2
LKKVLIAVVIVLVATALYFYNFDKNYRNLLGKQLKASYILHNPDKPLPKFSLLDHNRQLFDNERLKKGWLLLLFIYTHCPDVCPTELLIIFIKIIKIKCSSNQYNNNGN